jgi:hypothetical protein
MRSTTTKEFTMTQKARPSNYNHLKKEWLVVSKRDSEVVVLSKKLTHKQAIEMVIYLNRNIARPDLDIQKVISLDAKLYEAKEGAEDSFSNLD